MRDSFGKLLCGLTIVSGKLRSASEKWPERRTFWQPLRMLLQHHTLSVLSPFLRGRKGPTVAQDTMQPVIASFSDTFANGAFQLQGIA